jgi:predicted ATPase
VQLVRERFVVVPLGDSGIDYRRVTPPPTPEATRVADASAAFSLPTRPRGVYYHGMDARGALEAQWLARSTPGSSDASGRIDVGFGRTMTLHRMRDDACWFDFAALCGRDGRGSARGGNDFLALASHCRTLFLEGVPSLGPRQRNEARRFVILIDALYEARTQLYLSAELEPTLLFSPLLESTDLGAVISGAEVEVGRDGATTIPPGTEAPSFQEAPVGGRFRTDGELATFFTAKDEGFMLRRTMSRLAEMCALSPAAAGGGP